MTFDLKRLLHAMSGISEDALHSLTGCVWKHLAQSVHLAAERFAKGKEMSLFQGLNILKALSELTV